MFILGWIFFGALTGWVASKIVNRRGEGCIVNTALGLVGAVVGGFLFRALVPGFSYEYSGFFVSMLVAVLGAIIVLFLYHAATGSRTLR
ncbi:MAG: GlsB/YeaQ/YmgE family stress response membrane protein [Pseudomonadota bacterium]